MSMTHLKQVSVREWIISTGSAALVFSFSSVKSLLVSLSLLLLMFFPNSSTYASPSLSISTLFHLSTAASVSVLTLSVTLILIIPCHPILPFLSFLVWSLFSPSTFTLACLCKAAACEINYHCITPLYLASWRHCCWWNDTYAVLFWFNASSGAWLWIYAWRNYCIFLTKRHEHV